MNIFKIGSLLSNFYVRFDIYKPKFIRYQRLAWINIINVGCARFLWGRRKIKNTQKTSR